MITAAHCVSPEAREINYLVGGSSLCGEDDWVLRRSEDVTLIPAVDVASSGPAKIDTRPGKALPEGSTVIVEGWGFMSGDANCELSRVELEVLGAPVCAEAARRAGLDVLEPSRWACGFGPALCSGFSGSGAYQDGELVGLVSFGSGCGEPKGVAFIARVIPPERDL